MVQDLGLTKDVIFVGHLPSADAVYDRADVVVLPSRSEGLPNTLLEAMRADRPTVATAVGGIPEVVGSGAAALVVPPENPPALAEALQRVLECGDNPEARHARQQVCHSFSLERRVSVLAELYRELAGGTVR